MPPNAEIKGISAESFLHPVYDLDFLVTKRIAGASRRREEWGKIKSQPKPEKDNNNSQDPSRPQRYLSVEEATERRKRRLANEGKTVSRYQMTYSKNGWEVSEIRETVLAEPQPIKPPSIVPPYITFDALVEKLTKSEATKRLEAGSLQLKWYLVSGKVAMGLSALGFGGGLLANKPEILTLGLIPIFAHVGFPIARWLKEYLPQNHFKTSTAGA